ncbi:MobA protein [Bacteroides caecimuris]|uniref:plasmid mobilization protein n=1 Tax=Bacteroides caecimuris TaxID=1796613 RepID=UPI00321F6BB9
MGKYSNNRGRRPKADPSVNRYVVRFNVEENARFLSMFEQSEAVNKAVFIKNFIFQKPFKIFVVNENTRIFINQLSSLNALYRTYGVSYNTLVKTLRENFSEKKGNAAIERLREATMRLVFVCIDSQELIK